MRRRRRSRIVAGGAVAAVVAIVVVLVAVKVLSGSGTPATADTFPTGPAPTQVVSAVTTMPVSQQAAAAKATKTVAPTPINGPPLTADGRPEVLYIGAEFCPFCAAERWALVSALSHFGTWSGLEITHSSSTDVYPNTPTLSFAHATFTSNYLTFRSVEETTNQKCQVGTAGCAGNGYGKLQDPTAAEQQLLDTYDQQGSIPFIDFGGRAVLIGSSYDPQTLAGQNPATVAERLGQPTTADAQQIGAAAATITATLCRLTGGQPASVCAAVR
jgi:hypothetical protein